MPLLKISCVKLNSELRPTVTKSFVTDDEWSVATQSLLRQGAKRTNAGKVFTLVTQDFVQVTEIVVK